MKKTFIKIIACLLLISAVVCIAASCAGEKTETAIKNEEKTSSRTKEENGRNLRVGAYVWYAYSYLDWYYWSDRFIDYYADYWEPEFGYGYCEVEDMEYQIDLAIEYGLSFFSFEYWYAETPDHPSLSHLDHFVKAKNRDKIDFDLLVVNDDSTCAFTPKNWTRQCDPLVEYMSMDNYLKLDGKPVIQFWSPEILIKTLGGIEQTKTHLNKLRERMKKKGYPDIVILAGDQPYGDYNGLTGSYIGNTLGNVNPRQYAERINAFKEAGFDGMAGSLTYRLFIPDAPTEEIMDQEKYKRPFRELLDLHEKSWLATSEYTDFRMSPGITNGWDDRQKWNYWSNPSYYYTEGITGERFYQHVLDAYDWIAENPDNSVGNIVHCYAWDETDEGAAFIPTKGRGYTMLEALRRAIDDINAKEENK